MSKRKQASGMDILEKRGSHNFILYTIFLFFIIFVIFLVVFYRSFLTVTNTLKNDIEINVIYRVAENSLDIRKNIKSLANLIDRVVQRSEIQSMKWKEQEPILLMECENYGIESIQIADMNGNAKSTRGYEENIQETDYFKQAVNSLPSVSEPFVRSFDGKTVVLYSAPIQDKRGRVRGVMIAHMDMQFLFNTIDSMNLGRTGHGFIVNRAGNLLAYLPMNKDAAELTTSLNLSDMDNFDSISLFYRMIHGEVGHGYISNNGTQEFVAFNPVPHTNWFLGLAIERREMFFEVDAVAGQFTAVFITLIIFNILFAIYFIRYYIQNQKLLVLKQASEKNNRLLLETREIDRIRTEFFANISHELRTPLNVILSSTQLMDLYLKNKQSLEKQTAQKHLKMIRRNSLRLNRLINNIIDTTRINSQFYELHTSRCDIVQIVREISVSVEDYVQRKEITLSFYADVQEKSIVCDVDKVERILLNLLSNAIKFTDEGGRIAIFLNDGEAFINIVVEDTGIGIPKDKVEQIFTRFRQVDRTFTRNYKGSGIGLSLVKSMVELHGGTISVSSTPGKGSKFIVRLPAEQPEHEPAAEFYQYDRNQSNQRVLVEMSDFFPQTGTEE